MNCFMKAFCRAFPFCFRIAMPILPYREPERLTRMEELAQALAKKHIQTALLVTDAYLKTSGATAELELSSQALRKTASFLPKVNRNMPGTFVSGMFLSSRDRQTPRFLMGR